VCGIVCTFIKRVPGSSISITRADVKTQPTTLLTTKLVHTNVHTPRGGYNSASFLSAHRIQIPKVFLQTYTFFLLSILYIGYHTPVHCNTTKVYHVILKNSTRVLFPEFDCASLIYSTLHLQPFLSQFPCQSFVFVFVPQDKSFLYFMAIHAIKEEKQQDGHHKTKQHND
jgi:hypothetical protein